MSHQTSPPIFCAKDTILRLKLSCLLLSRPSWIPMYVTIFGLQGQCYPLNLWSVWTGIPSPPFIITAPMVRTGGWNDETIHFGSIKKGVFDPRDMLAKFMSSKRRLHGAPQQHFQIHWAIVYVYNILWLYELSWYPQVVIIYYYNHLWLFLIIITMIYNHNIL